MNAFRKKAALSRASWRSSFGIAATILAFGAAPPQSSADGPPRFRTLAECLAAYKSEHALAMEANARLGKAQFNSSAESKAMDDQNRHTARANEINKVCETMKLAESGLTLATPRPRGTTGTSGDDLRAVHDLLGELDPLRGTQSPVTRAIQDENISKVQEAHVALGERMDRALSDFRDAGFGGAPKSGNTVSPLASSLQVRTPTAAVGTGAAEDLRSDMTEWRTKEAERQRLAAIEAERHQRIAAQRAAEDRARRLAEAEAEEEARQRRQASTSSVMNTLGFAFGMAIAGADRNQIAGYFRNQAIGEAYGGSPISSAPASGGGEAELEAQCPGLMARIRNEAQTRPTSGGICENTAVLVGSLRRSESILRSCSRPYARQSLAEVQETIRSTEAANASACR